MPPRPKGQPARPASFFRILCLFPCSPHLRAFGPNSDRRCASSWQVVVVVAVVRWHGWASIAGPIEADAECEKCHCCRDAFSSFGCCLVGF